MYMYVSVWGLEFAYVSMVFKLDYVTILTVWYSFFSFCSIFKLKNHVVVPS